jgi:HD superfamily phosphohydrolase
MPKFRDPVHGFIYISEGEKKIVDSPPFQRLRNIRQLAATYLVYHGAEHTRFGHSLGVMHLVTRTFNSVVETNPKLFREDEAENEAFVLWYRQILRLIALTHDLGHAPFSHATESLFPDDLGHEEYTKLIIEETEISGYIRAIGSALNADIAKRLEVTEDGLAERYNIRPITPELLWMIYGEKPSVRVSENKSEYIWPDFVFLKSFMDGELDCDKMDYLLRDSLYCGVAYGKYDLDRFISTLTVYKKQEEEILELAIGRGGVQAFEEFVLARYFMFIQVYFHKTRRYFDRLLSESLKEILPEGRYPAEIQEYLKWDDVRAIEAMRKSEKPFSTKYLRRQTMTCFRETSAHAEKAEGRLFNAAYNMAKLEFGENSILFDEVDKYAHKLLPTLFSEEDDSGKGVKIVDRAADTVRNIMSESRILRGIIERIYICRLYVGGIDAENIKSRVQEIIDVK